MWCPSRRWTCEMESGRLEIEAYKNIYFILSSANLCIENGTIFELNDLCKVSESTGRGRPVGHKRNSFFLASYSSIYADYRKLSNTLHIVIYVWLNTHKPDSQVFRKGLSCHWYPSLKINEKQPRIPFCMEAIVRKNPEFIHVQRTSNSATVKNECHQTSRQALESAIRIGQPIY